MERRMGRWSELREIEVDQEKEEAIWAEARERSGEEGEPLEGRRMGESRLRVTKGEYRWRQRRSRRASRWRLKTSCRGGR